LSKRILSHMITEETGDQAKKRLSALTWTPEKLEEIEREALEYRR